NCVPTLLRHQGRTPSNIMLFSLGDAPPPPTVCEDVFLERNGLPDFQRAGLALFRSCPKPSMSPMFRTLTKTAAWTSLVFIAYATLSPLSERPELETVFSHLDHYLAFAVAGSLFGLAYPRQTLFVCILVLGSAVLLEMAQLLTPDRHARVIDAARKIIGGAIG